MNEPLPKELIHARELMDQAKFIEALEIIDQFEKDESLSLEDRLSALGIKGRIYAHTQQFGKLVELCDSSYELAQSSMIESEVISNLIGKAYIGFLGDLDKASNYLSDAERKMNSLSEDPSKMMLKWDLLFIKSWILILKNKYTEAAALAQECLKLTKDLLPKNLRNRLDLAVTYRLVGQTNIFQGNTDDALKCAMKSLEINKELNHPVAIANNYSFIARIYRSRGDYDQALQYCNKCLSIKEITRAALQDVLMLLGETYYAKSEINLSLEYLERAAVIAEELNSPRLIIVTTYRLGYIYRMIGKLDTAIEYFERMLTLSERWGLVFHIAQALSSLTTLYLDKKSREKANRYFSRLTQLYERLEETGVDFSIFYLWAKAYMMKTSTRIRDRAEAQALFKELIDLSNEDTLIYCMGSLCDLLLEELSLYGDPKVLDEILPLLLKSINMAEEAHNFNWLAETKLLQAKLALIQINIQEGKKLMLEAQRIAETHGLSLLAWGISTEHDKLLEQINTWDSIREKGAPMAERIKLASTNGVIERIQGKQTVQPPESGDEEPILLLIMDNNGATYFSHRFVPNWDYGDLFSDFMSAFNTFSKEIFSNSIDRIKSKENTILIHPVDPFLACYVIKGQSYPALQKLTRFTEAIQENSEIWDALNKAIKTSEMLELKKPPTLKTIIDEIFI
ncbi:MAG: tetratricopeptide repeat protein [Promethearchaeota archaeon]|jgi:tetratricopeptide (TPR) repeat protein